MFICFLPQLCYFERVIKYRPVTFLKEFLLMILTKKTMLSLGCVSLFNLNVGFAGDDSKEKKGFSDIVLSKVQEDRVANLATRVIAKTAIEIAAKKIKADTEEEKAIKEFNIAALSKALAKDTGKQLAGVTLEELAPLYKDASLAEQHLDLIAATILSNVYNNKEKYKVKTNSTADLQKALLDAFKKETGKGFLINKDFNALKDTKDLGLFTIDCLTEFVKVNKDSESTIKVEKEEFKKALESIINTKIISPLIMAYAGNDLSKGLVKTKNKKIQKMVSGLMEKHFVNTLIRYIIGELAK
jgi:hypothetical protein